MNDSAKNELVDLLLPGGHEVHVNVTQSIQDGLLDSDMETTGEVMQAVQKTLSEGNHLVTHKGFPVILCEAPVAMYYRRLA